MQNARSDGKADSPWCFSGFSPHSYIWVLFLLCNHNDNGSLLNSAANESRVNIIRYWYELHSFTKWSLVLSTRPTHWHWAEWRYEYYREINCSPNIILVFSFMITFFMYLCILQQSHILKWWFSADPTSDSEWNLIIFISFVVIAQILVPSNGRTPKMFPCSVAHCPAVHPNACRSWFSEKLLTDRKTRQRHFWSP